MVFYQRFKLFFFQINTETFEDFCYNSDFIDYLVEYGAQDKSLKKWVFSSNDIWWRYRIYIQNPNIKFMSNFLDQSNPRSKY